MIAVNNKKTVTRFTKVVNSKRRSLFFEKLKPDLTGVFPDDIFSDYVADYRLLDDHSALLCGIPKEQSYELAGLFKDMGQLPLRLDVYANCVSLVLERGGGNAVCVVKGGIIYVCGGILKEIMITEGEHELKVMLDSLGETEINAYNPAGYDWTDRAFTRAGIEPQRGYELGLMGLLGVN
jgi:hypothetical protein